ncbi:hypothetical protein HUO09_06945 [Vibrio sp. Y2-5]|uniref:hypothetical protein n=1 Tax=Vibrio sp. Y2-5 TaxID=2743977 RepID=UPI0016618205|nr:hypothetical protein [Vibrio sp. Y2-5]MBD0786074.1 hypothetical protein [Vibrio sp. Y2-5]
MSTLHTDTLVSTVQPVDGSEPAATQDEIKATEEKGNQPTENTASEELIIIEPATTSPTVSTTTEIEQPKAVSKVQTTEKKVNPEEAVATKTTNIDSLDSEVKQKETMTAAILQSDNLTDSEVKTQPAQEAELLVITTPQQQNTVDTDPQKQVATTVVSTAKPSVSAAETPFNTDWILIAAFILTSIIVLISNRKAIKNATALAKESSRPVMPTINPTIDVEFEKAKIVAESRQQWIHSLRSDIADFVSATNAIWDLHKIKDGFEDILTDMKDPQFAMKELYQWSCTYNKAVQDTEKLYAKIHLLINPNEEHSQTLSSLLDKTMVAIEAKKSPSKLNDEIVAITQVILKQEWQRVKTFS